jgi:hypothetical protein
MSFVICLTVNASFNRETEANNHNSCLVKKDSKHTDLVYLNIYQTIMSSSASPIRLLKFLPVTLVV